MKFVAFDIETSDELPEGFSLDEISEPIGISCIATVEGCVEDDIPPSGKLVDADNILERVLLWYPGISDGMHPGDVDGEMSKADLLSFLDYIEGRHSIGVRSVSWNGTSFDYRVIGMACGDLDRCGRLALDHFDPMLQFFLTKGYPISLASVTKAIKYLPNKLMSGADAPVLWNGDYGDRMKVLDYVSMDAVITLMAAETFQYTRTIPWVAKSGNNNRLYIEKGLLPVKDCLAMEVPDTSWMKEPIPRENFIGWIV